MQSNYIKINETFLSIYHWGWNKNNSMVNSQAFYKDIYIDNAIFDNERIRDMWNFKIQKPLVLP